MEKIFYRVSLGDTVSKISAEFDVSVNSIIRDNNLKREILAGDLLIIKKRNGVRYRVQLTDTVDSIADKFNIDKNTLLDKNGVDYIYYGQILDI